MPCWRLQRCSAAPSVAEPSYTQLEVKSQCTCGQQSASAKLPALKHCPHASNSSVFHTYLRNFFFWMIFSGSSAPWTYQWALRPQDKRACHCHLKIFKTVTTIKHRLNGRKYTRKLMPLRLGLSRPSRTQHVTYVLVTNREL